MRRLSNLNVVLGCCVVFATAHVPQTCAVEIQRDVPMPMSDGVVLLADVYRPDGVGRAPTIITRTPYNRRGKEFIGVAFAEHGYAVVIQDVRGMNGSGGRFVPFRHEKRDGLETLQWVTQQPWCDGRVGLWGLSYPGFAGLIVAAQDPPSVKAVVNVSGWGDTMEMTSPGGALHLMCALPWTLSPQIRGRGSVGDFDWPATFRHLPVIDIPASLGVRSETWDGALRLFRDDALRRDANALEGWTSGSVAVLHITGWYDFLARHTLDVYESIDQKAGARERAVQQLIVGPWRHDQVWLDDARVGDENFGQAAVLGKQKLIDLSLQWFDRYLRDDSSGGPQERPVRLFVMGENAWREFDHWPPGGASFEKWFLCSGGSANGRDGDGRLALEAPSADTNDHFTYDPNDPVPTTGGANFHFFPDNLGVKDQRAVETRPDVLVYTSAPFPHDVTLVGPLRAVVYAATTGGSADFTAKLVEVRLDGYAAIIDDGIRHGPDPEVAADALKPGVVYRYTIEMGATALCVRKGHRLRVEISSSNFPKYIRNPGTAEDPSRATQLQRTEQTLIHSPQYPSHVLLPVLRD